MKKLLVAGLIFALPLVAMAGNYKGSTITKSSITADDSTSAIDLRGFSQLSSEVVFATCTGAAADTGDLYLQTSNDNLNWFTILTIAADSGAGLTGDVYFDYLPDGATANQGGFGRYVRWYWDEQCGTPNVSYTIYYEAKE